MVFRTEERTLTICHEIVKRGLNIQFETPNGLSMKTLDKEVLDALTDVEVMRLHYAQTLNALQQRFRSPA